MIKRLIESAALKGIPFGLLWGLFVASHEGSSFAFAFQAGVAAGVFFGLAMAIFEESQRKKMESKNGIFEREEIVYQGPANHRLRGGWLTLTPSRLSFRSHGKNFQNQPLDLGIGTIADAIPIRTAGIIPNGLLVITNKGEQHSFVVSNRMVWTTLIKKIKGKPATSNKGQVIRRKGVRA